MVSLKQNSGFTLLEIMTVITIIVILSTIIVADYGSFGKKNAVVAAAQGMASNIRKAQSFSLSGKDVHKLTENNDGRWGLYFGRSQTDYVIFADTNKNNAYDSDEDYLTVNLPRGVTIDSFLNGGDSVSLLYIPPNPIIVLKNSAMGATTSEEIILKENSSGYIKKVQINNFGLVNISD